MTTQEKRILVIGAGGRIGGPVAEHLHSIGHPVRVFGRKLDRLRQRFGEEYEFAQGDVSDIDSLNRAMEGCYGVHISIAGGPRVKDFERVEHHGVANITCAAEKAGIQQITHLSGSTVEDESETPFIQMKLGGENALLNCVVPSTIFRASWFMESLIAMDRGGNILIPGRQPNLFRFIAASDFAGMVATAFEKSTGNGIFYAYGPQTLQMKEAAWMYVKAFHPQGQVKSMSLKSFKFLTTFLPKAAKSYAVLMEHFETHAEPVHPGAADEVFGRNKTTLAKWIEARLVGDGDDEE